MARSAFSVAVRRSATVFFIMRSSALSWPICLFSRAQYKIVKSSRIATIDSIVSPNP